MSEKDVLYFHDGPSPVVCICYMGFIVPSCLDSVMSAFFCLVHVHRHVLEKLSKVEEIFILLRNITLFSSYCCVERLLPYYGISRKKRGNYGHLMATFDQHSHFAI